MPVETADFHEGAVLHVGGFLKRVSSAEVLKEEPLVGGQPLDFLVERSSGARGNDLNRTIIQPRAVCSPSIRPPNGLPVAARMRRRGEGGRSRPAARKEGGKEKGKR
jgi:hypothetical protein